MAQKALKLVKHSEGKPIVGWFGGHPRGISLNTWPRCAVCGAPMCHMAQFDSGPWLDLGEYERLSVFICHATGGRCEDWLPFKGSNKIVLQRTKNDSLLDGPPTVRVYRKMLLTTEDLVGDEVVDKIGGLPDWLGRDQTPESPTGMGPSNFAIQLTTNLVRFDITDGGMAYIFVDPFQEGAYMAWQARP